MDVSSRSSPPSLISPVERWLDEQMIRPPIAAIDTWLVAVRWSILLLSGVPFLLNISRPEDQGQSLGILAGILLFNGLISVYALRKRPLTSGRTKWLLLADFIQLYVVMALTGGYQSLFFTLSILLMTELALSVRWHVALAGVMLVGFSTVVIELLLGVPTQEPLAMYMVLGKFTISVLFGLMVIMFSELTRREQRLRHNALLAAARVTQLNHLLMRLGESKFNLQQALEAILEGVHAVPDVAYSLVLMRSEDKKEWYVAASSTPLHPVGESLAGLPIEAHEDTYFSAGKGTSRPLPAFAVRDPIQRLSGVYLRTPEGETLGMLLLGRRNGRSLPAFEQSYLQSLAIEAGMALRNARIYAKERQHRRSLQQFQKAQSIYFSAISHELKIPLSVIKMLLPMLEHPEKMTEETHEEIYETLENNLQRLENLINDILESAKLEAGVIQLHRDQVDVGKLVSRTLVNMEPLLAQKNQQAQMNIEPVQVWAWADRRRVEEVLTNLISNASKFSPASSPILVQVKEKKGEIQICVLDNGPGIPDEQKEHIFERFYSTSEDAALAGVGLGLFIARKLVELHGGRIWVEDRHAGGSRFCFTLPPLLDEVENDAKSR